MLEIVEFFYGPIYLDRGFPVAANGEKVTSKSSSIPQMFSTKNLNFKQKMFRACFRTSSK